MPEPNGNSFRSAGFGGFKKKDVVAYIQEQTRKYTKQISTLEKSLDEAVSEKKALQNEQEATQVTLNSLTSRVEELEKEAAEAAVLRTALAEVQTEKAALQKELDLLKKEAGDIFAMKTKLEVEKAALVQMEVEARLRADKVETDARDKAEELANRYSREVADAIRVFTHFKGNADTMLLSASEQLRSILALFSEMEKELLASGSVFEDLSSLHD
ncbi:MAG: hypothetical protein IIY12_01780 [Clostridia bacterium]|nr:hypothetical protein [Clostridia bacterium]